MELVVWSRHPGPRPGRPSLASQRRAIPLRGASSLLRPRLAYTAHPLTLGFVSSLQSVTPKQTGALYFRLEVLAEPLGNFVRHLDADRFDDSLAAPLACALRKLPNLSSLDLGWRVAHDHVPGEENAELSDERAALQSSMRFALGKATSLKLETSDDSSLLKTIACVDGARLRKLHWVEPEWPPKLDDELRRAMGSLVGLVELEVSALYKENYTHARRCPPFSTVRSVVLSNTRLDYRQNLELAHYLAPSATRLAIFDARTTPADSDGTEPLPSPLMPALKSLIVEAWAYLPIFHHFDLPALEHFKLSLRKSCTKFPLDIVEVPFKAAPLRTFTLAFRANPHLKASRALVRLFQDAYVRLIIEQGPMSLARLKSRTVESMDTKAMVVIDRRKHGTIVNTLDWARRRADWLYDVGDGPGLHELAHATARLHERFLMERS